MEVFSGSYLIRNVQVKYPVVVVHVNFCGTMSSSTDTRHLEHLHMPL